MRLPEIYNPKPAQNSTERGAGYRMKVRSSFPVSFLANISDRSLQDPQSQPGLKPHLCPPEPPPFP